MTPSRATDHYRNIFASRTAEELRTLALVKRFVERVVGDAGFREALARHPDDPRIVAERYGIDIDPLEMLPLWRAGYSKYRGTLDCAQWPLVVMWDKYVREALHHRDLLREEGSLEGIHPRFHEWRERQMKRCASELGGSAPSVTFPILSFELSEGCSVGCWFCGISADRFKGYWPYDEHNAALWRSVVTATQELFGTAARTGFCYWATDPCDNPDYDRFIHDYYLITGSLPQTTTAAPFKNPELMQRILALYDRYRTVTNRFSVLTKKHLDQIHAAFRPDRMLGVELVMQQKEALTARADAGRAHQRRLKLRAANKDDTISTVANDHTTIACVSGFLVNMMQGQIRLITPVPGSDRWPLGYRILGERWFKTATEFRQGLESLIDEHMTNQLPPEQPISFRRDLRHEQDERTFTLTARNRTYTVSDEVGSVPIGDLIATGALTPGEIVDRAAADGFAVAAIAGLIDDLYTNGLLEEDLDDTFAGVKNEGLVLRAAALARALDRAGAAPEDTQAHAD